MLVFLVVVDINKYLIKNKNHELDGAWTNS